MILSPRALLGYCIFAAVFFSTGCSTNSTPMHTQTVPDSDYKDALEWTDPQRFELPAPGSPEEAKMLGSVKQLFADYTRENLEAKIPEVYAEKVYFRDAFKQFDSAEAIRHYMVEGLAALEDAEFVFRRVARAEGEFYLDWVMRLDFKKTPSGTWEESIGMTHMRFNSEGQVIFHQDYWDPTDIVYRRIPVAKQLINFVKKKM